MMAPTRSTLAFCLLLGWAANGFSSAAPGGLARSAGISSAAPRGLVQSAARASVCMGAKKPKSHFEAYRIPERGMAGIFDPPLRRDAVRPLKKHLPEGAPVGKAPDGWAARWMPTLDTSRKTMRLLHLCPPVLVVDNFLSADECDALVALTEGEEAYEVQSATFSALTAAARTSTTWYTKHTAVPTLIGRAVELTGADPNTFEEPQIVRYKVGQRFSWHYDEVPKSLLAKEGSGGQRRATLLVYLNDVALGGATAFRDLGVTVQPRKGRALLFFPSDCDSTPDERTLHAGEAPLQGEKWIAQFWLHERSYTPVVVPGSGAGAAAEAFAAYRSSAGGVEAAPVAPAAAAAA
ncbi:hypothetical protein T492DRAFT_942798, partial [Pavlovales sp. CCMP2436]